MSFAWYPDRGRFTGAAGLPCAYAPEGRSDEVPSDYGLEPPSLGPSR